MADTPTTGWDVQRIHAEVAAIETAIEAAHTGTEPCCCACPACAMARSFTTRMMPLFAQQTADAQRKASAAMRLAEDAMRQVEEVNNQTAAHSALHADYEALHADHTALLLDHDALQAAYKWTQRTLRRAQKDAAPELH